MIKTVEKSLVDIFSIGFFIVPELDVKWQIIEDRNH